MPSCHRRHLVALLIAVSAVATGPALAQTANPRYAEFTPSPDHSAIVPIVTNYEIRIFPAGSSEAVRILNIGKPSPASNGLILVDFLPLLVEPLQPGTVYEARVAAVGPGGASASDPSNTFVFTVSCATSVTPISRTVSAAAATGSVSVAAASDCAWTASSSVSWLAITAGSSGSGNGSVSYSVAPNTSTSPRIGTISVGGQTFTLSQAGATCTYALSPAGESVPATASSRSLTVTATGGCAWTASSSVSWLGITGGGAGSGNGTVSYSVAANPTASPRTGTLVVAGQTFTVLQAGTSVPPPSNLRVITR
jgi:hypothetical protein